MPKYKATVHVSGLNGDSPTSVRSALDDQLKKVGIENYRVVAVEPEGWARAAQRATATAAPPNDSAWRRQANAGGLLLVAAAAWAVWFFWWMFSVGPE
jgi:ferric-dicitrate binding protein FerR (iron transport regulator)